MALHSIRIKNEELVSNRDAITRFRYRASAAILLWFINGLLYAVWFKNGAVAGICFAAGALITAIAYWVFRNPELSRIKIGITLGISFSASALLVLCLITGLNKSPLIWYILLAPVLAAYLHSVRVAIYSAVVGLLFLGSIAFINATLNPNAFDRHQDTQSLLVQIILLVALAILSILSRKATDSYIQELDLARKEALDAKKKALDASQAKSDFLANMSHEIRTPLNGVIGVNRLLENTVLSDEQKSLLDISMIASESLLHLVNEILDLSKIEAGKLELEAAPFLLTKVIASAISIQQDSASRKGLNIECHSTLPQDLWLLGDALRLRQVILNLASNAIKFTSHGQVSLNCSQTFHEGKRIRILVEVSDTGLGMSPTQQARLFSAYSQTDTSIARKYGGTGLGLAISQQLVELMGGKIGVRSTLGEGSTFWFEIPFTITEAADQVPMDESDSDDEVEISHLTGSILVAEDNAVNQIIIRKLLEKLGLQVHMAANGKEALDAMAHQSFDLIILDCQMPIMDGFTACKTIRSESKPSSNIPIVALTASALKEDEKKCLEAGMNAFLTKPIDPDNLYLTLKKWLP